MKVGLRFQIKTWKSKVIEIELSGWRRKLPIWKKSWVAAPKWVKSALKNYSKKMRF